MTATAPLSLYAIGQAYDELIDKIAENNGELTEELSLELAAIEDSFEVKAEKVALYIRNLEGLAKAAGAEAQRLADLEGHRQRTADSLKRYLFENMKLTGKLKIDRPLAKLSVVNNGGSLPVEWNGLPEEIPEGYRITKIVYSLDRAKVLADHKEQRPLPLGITVRERGQTLRIA